MDLKEILTTLENLKANGEININQIAETLGIQVVTEKHENAMKTLDELKKKLNSEDVMAEVNSLVANSENVKVEAFRLLRNNKMTEAFGPLKIGDKENLKRNAAEPLVSENIVDEKVLTEQIEKAKSNAVVQSFSYSEADITSETNDISGVDKTKKTNVENKSTGFITI